MSAAASVERALPGARVHRRAVAQRAAHVSSLSQSGVQSRPFIVLELPSSTIVPPARVTRIASSIAARAADAHERAVEAAHAHRLSDDRLQQPRAARVRERLRVVAARGHDLAPRPAASRARAGYRGARAP